MVASNGDVIAGHGRLAAARRLGLQEVPVIVIDHLNETQRRQLVLADNRIAINSGWDIEMLKLELKDLSNLGADLASLGFSKAELNEALAPFGQPGAANEEVVPPLEERAVTADGDIWCLGPHRVACGDSTDPAVVEALFTQAAQRRLDVVF